MMRMCRLEKALRKFCREKKIIARFHLLLLLNINSGLFDLPNSEVSFL